VALLESKGIRDRRVLEAFRRVDRAAFVPAALKERAWEDRPLPIGAGQTISQPYMVALMTELLELRGGERVLEIGTGSGFQTAMLAELGAKVYSVERLPELAEGARARLEGLGYAGSIRFRVGDGSLGWPEEAPFDRVLAAAGAPALPEAPSGQLGEGGILVLPLGGEGDQDLLRFRKDRGRLLREWICRCAFVKLVGREGWPS
jgi:protein-L-isoaspartate(D-aspartate) O-methyltransferase